MDFHFLIVGQIVGHFALAYPLFRQELNAPSGHPFDIVPLRLAVSRSLCPDRLFLFFPIRRIQQFRIFPALPVDLSPVADLQDEDDELAVPKVADEPVVSHAVTPIPRELTS